VSAMDAEARFFRLKEGEGGTKPQTPNPPRHEVCKDLIDVFVVSPGADKCPWGEKCTIKAVLGGLPAPAGDASVTLDLPDA